jgi:LysM repeat protein
MMNKKIDIMPIAALLIAVLTLLFGDNLYEQMTGHSVFEFESAPPQKNVFTPTDNSTYQLPVPSESITLNPNAAETPTNTNVIEPSSTIAAKTIPTIFPTSSLADSYTLQVGEFPFCIARRFDVDPEQLLSMNGLLGGQIIMYPMTLKIPLSGSFPGTRALRQHPTVYTASSGESIYSIACSFGDVFPEDIAELNGLSVNSSLNTDQLLNIP